MVPGPSKRRLDMGAGEAVWVGGAAVRGDWPKLFLKVVLVCNKMLPPAMCAPPTFSYHPNCRSPVLRALSQGVLGRRGTHLHRGCDTHYSASTCQLETLKRFLPP